MTSQLGFGAPSFSQRYSSQELKRNGFVCILMYVYMNELDGCIDECMYVFRGIIGLCLLLIWDSWRNIDWFNNLYLFLRYRVNAR